jgi:N-acetylglucosamine-6-phosphate deacetylase
MADGSRYRMGEIECIVDDGVRMTLDRSAFAKSIPFVSALIPIVISALEISLVEAVVMATSIPAKAARLCDVGRIAKGFRADFTLFDAHMAVRAVALSGEWK